MARNPLSYLGSQCVFQYLGADERFALAARCPSLRTVHKQAPLVIDRLELKENAFVLNDLEYNFRIFFEPEQLTSSQEHNNTNGGVTYDVDQFGRRDWNLYLEHGDIQVGEARTNNPARDERIHLREINLDRKAHGLPECKFTGMTEQRKVGLEVIPRPVYQQQACCVMRRGGESKEVGFPTGTKIRDAFRLQLGNLLNIKHPIIVRNLNIAIENGALRLPTTVALRARNLTTISLVLESTSLIVPSNHPIPNTVTQKITFDHLTIQCCRFSNNSDYMGRVFIDISPATLIKWSTRPIHLTHEPRFKHYLLALYRNWIQESRPINTKLTMSASDPMDYLKFFKDQTGIPFRGTMIRWGCYKCITTPVGKDKELNIYEKRDRLVMEMMMKGAAVEIGCF